jgi:hypothetical protein
MLVIPSVLYCLELVSLVAFQSKAASGSYYWFNSFDTFHQHCIGFILTYDIPHSWFDSKRKENSIFFLRAQRDRNSLVSSCLRATPICPIQSKPIAQDHPSIPTVLILL